jgi:hypothetical protein
MLTPGEIATLHDLGIHPSNVPDVRHSPDKVWKAAVRELEPKPHVVLGATCRNGHRLRTRAGHCIVCSPAALGFVRRSEAGGTVYIAISKKQDLVKIGYATDLKRRHRQFQKSKYAGADDWTLRWKYESPQAGRLELLAKRYLYGHRVEGLIYEHHTDGLQTADEVFSCEPEVAKEALIRAIRNYERLGNAA